MVLGKLRNPSDRSNASAMSMNTSGTPNVEYFWACELDAKKPSFEWSIPKDDLEDGDGDYIEHSLFIRSVCLGAGAVEKEENILVMESVGENGEIFKGTIANLIKGVNPMGSLSFTVDGKSGVKFTLVEGNGPISICGNHLLDYHNDDDLDMSQTEESRLDDSEELEDEEEDEEDEEDEEAEEEKAKGKAPTKSNKQKQKAKMAVEEPEEEDDDDDEDDEDFDEEEDEESDSEIKVKKGKKEGVKKAAKGPAKPGNVKETKKTKKAKKA